MNSLLFVYGTLKRNFYLSEWLNHGEFLSEGYTLPKFIMVNCGYFPGIVKNNHIIRGELYNIKTSYFPTLDRMEGIYHRELETILSPDGEEFFDVNIYILNPHILGNTTEKIQSIPPQPIMVFSWEQDGVQACYENTFISPQ